MAVYTVEQLSTMIDVLTARVAALDGIGLPSPGVALTTTVTALTVNLDHISGSTWNGLAARVSALDGIGLPDPSLGLNTVLTKRIKGVETALKQYVLTIQGQFQDLTISIANTSTLINSLTNHQ